MIQKILAKNFRSIGELNVDLTFAEGKAPNDIYTWTSTGYIPSIKKGKRLIFSKKDIDNWLRTGKRKSAAEIHAEAMQALANKKKGVAI